MVVAIAGAQGKIAMRLTRLLVARGDTVIGLIRNPDHGSDVGDAGASPVVCDLEQATAIRLLEAATAAAAPRFVILGSVGAENPPDGDVNGGEATIEQALDAVL